MSKMTRQCTAAGVDPLQALRQSPANLAKVYLISFNDAFLSLNQNFGIAGRRVSRKRHGFPAEVNR
jgi:hypothetical protein